MNQDELSLKRKIIEEIRKEMDKKELSQNDLGKLCGISRTHVNNILQETEAVSFKKLLKMANALNLVVDIKVTRGK